MLLSTFILRHAGRSFRSTSFLNFSQKLAYTTRPREMAISIPLKPHTTARAFDESRTVVTLYDSDGEQADDGEVFNCEEEPHMLPAWITGGYFPLQLGERLKSSRTEYEIVRKIGWNEGSSVWLASYNWGKDGAGYVALKMLTAGEPFAEGSKEDRSLRLRLVSKLNLAIHHGTAPVGSDCCVQTFESFVVGSKHGEHLCLVTPPYGSSIEEFVRDGDRRILPFSPDTTKNFGRQILLALSCIHSLGFVHTNVKASSIYMNLSDPQTITQILRDSPSLSYEPQMEPDISPDPIITVRSQPLTKFDSELQTMRVYLGDFEDAVPVDQTAQKLATTATPLCPPEYILGHSWGTSFDVWCVGCFLLDAITGKWGKIFNLDSPAGMTHTEVHLARMEELLGPFPAAFLERCSKTREFFDAHGRLLKPLASFLDPVAGFPPSGSLRERLEQAHLSGAELDRCEAFFRRCFQLDPELRLSAQDMLQDPWLTPESA